MKHSVDIFIRGDKDVVKQLKQILPAQTEGGVDSSLFELEQNSPEELHGHVRVTASKRNALEAALKEFKTLFVDDQRIQEIEVAFHECDHDEDDPDDPAQRLHVNSGGRRTGCKNKTIILKK